jgi:hypothetical protein
MNSLAYSDNNILKTIEIEPIEHKEVIVSENNHRSSMSLGQNLSHNGEVHHSDISTASYLRGYN